MKLSELEVGKIYECKLSGQNILVIETEEQIVKDEQGVENIIEGKKAGKAVVKLDSGDYKFVYTELHDGQLK